MVRDPAERYYAPGRIRLRQLRQLVYPRRCPFCRRVLGFVPVCPDCAEALKKLERKPSRRLNSGEHYFGSLEGAAAPFVYGDEVRSAILRAKYLGESWTAVQLGCWVARLLFGAEIDLKAGVAVPQQQKALGLEYDQVVPVPSSRRGRGYNVPALMALPVAQALGLPLEPEALVRIHKNSPQASLSMEERLVNIAGAFRAQEPQQVEGKRILLVDDVITTGATASACAQALLDAGAQSVFAIALAAAEVNKRINKSESI